MNYRKIASLLRQIASELDSSAGGHGETPSDYGDTGGVSTGILYPFGKHKGSDVGHAPRHYAKWFLENISLELTGKYGQKNQVLRDAIIQRAGELQDGSAEEEQSQTDAQTPDNRIGEIDDLPF